MDKPNILILGGGFGGVRCALDLASKFGERATITVIDRNGYHFFTPALYEVASAYLTGRSDPYQMRLRRAIAIPYNEIFANRSVNIIQAEIASVDLERKHGILDNGQAIDYDYLVLSLGGQTADFGIPGVNEYAYQFKTTDDAIALNIKLNELFQAVSEGRVQAPIKMLVIGAGFAGTELAAELVMCAQKLAKQYRLERRAFSVVLFEATPTILPMISQKERKLIMDRLTNLGVAIMAGTPIESVQADSVKLKNGQLVSGSAVIWTAGVQANKIAATIHGLPLTDRGKIKVDQYLNAQGLPNIFAIGDIVECIDIRTQKPVPGLAQTAEAQGALVAKNIYAKIFDKKLHEYHPEYETWVAPVGGKYAVAHISRSLSVSGLAGWIVRNLVDLRYFLSILSFPKAFRLFQRDLMTFSKND